MHRTKLAKEIHQTAKEKGWWDKDRNHDEMFMLIITELSEAIEADRKSRRANTKMFKEMLEAVEMPDHTFKEFFNMHIKDTVEDELADAYIRCLDYLYYRYGDNIIFPDIIFKPGENFAENIFSICRTVCDRLIKEVAIYIENLCTAYSIDLQYHVIQKMKYNKMRSQKHGGKKY